MTAPILDREALKDWIAKRLGEPVVKVELSEDHYNDAIDDAKLWYASKRGIVKTISFAIVANQTEYTLPEEANIITNIALPSNTNSMAELYAPFAWFLPDQTSFPAARMWRTQLPYSNAQQLQMYEEMGKRVSSNEPTWYQQNNKLILSPPPKYGGTSQLSYTTKDFTIEQIPIRDHDLLKKRALANAMEDLGIIRTKYDSYPTAQGSVQLNGQLLLDRAQAMKDQLDIDIKTTSTAPFAILVG